MTTRLRLHIIVLAALLLTAAVTALRLSSVAAPASAPTASEYCYTSYGLWVLNHEVYSGGEYCVPGP
jgi:hypothetical protein